VPEAGSDLQLLYSISPGVKPVTTKSQRSAARAKSADGANIKTPKFAAILRFFQRAHRESNRFLQLWIATGVATRH
jgi:hypothetical protein